MQVIGSDAISVTFVTLAPPAGTNRAPPSPWRMVGRTPMLGRVSETKVAAVIGAAVRRRRRALGLTMADLATLAQVDARTYGKLERGNGVPTLRTLLRVASTLECSVADLVADVGPDLHPDGGYVTARAFIAERARRAAEGTRP